MDDRECIHDWEAPGAWGVIIGASKCKRCGKVSQSSDFPANDRCRVCGASIATAKLCSECADGNDPFFTADNCGADLKS